MNDAQLNADILASALNIEPSITTTNTAITLAVDAPSLPKTDNTLEDDTEFVRENLYNIIRNGNKALELIALISSESQHPSALRVMSELITSLSNATDKLMKLQIDKQKILRDSLDDHIPTAKESKTTIGVIEQAVFLSDSDQLSRMMKEQNKEEEPYVIELSKEDQE